MRWSVALEAEGDRVIAREEVVELADAVAGHGGVASGIGTPSYAARSSSRQTPGIRRLRPARPFMSEAARHAGLPAWPVTVADAVEPGRRGRGRVIRLGSLAGYPFEGPRLLAGWTPPAAAAVYASCAGRTPSSTPTATRSIYVGHADDLSTDGFPFRHPQRRVLGAPGRRPLEGPRRDLRGSRRALRSHREQIAQELTAVYKPGCNERQVDRSWKREWIGEYSAPTTGPLTTGRDPDPDSP